jgi:putative FmdB family regulatory protein
MPLFEFSCNDCRVEFEALCRDTRAEGLTCPKCGADSPSRLISRFAVSRQVSPCGTPASERAASSCGFDPMSGGCGRCAH